MDLSIRPATKEDATLIADLSRQTFLETFEAHNTKDDMDKFLGEQFTRGKLLLEVGSPGLDFYLAYSAGQPAGYLKLREGPVPQALRGLQALEIARLYALKHMVGKGVGKALMQKSLDVAAERGKEVVWLGVWEHNQTAINFYHRWGFERFGEQDFLLGNDLQRDWLMKRSV